MLIMRKEGLTVLNSLLICMMLQGCSPDIKNRTVQSGQPFIQSDYEMIQKSPIVWKNKYQGFFTDQRDGKKYKIVKIGSQIWFAENLAFEPDSGKYWVYDNNEKYITQYGFLYYYKTAIKSCPPGWHLPSLAEWEILIDYFGGKSVAGIKMKSKSGWNCHHSPVINDMGFNILPGGNRAIGGSFYHLGDDALLWSCTLYNGERAWKIRINCEVDSVGFQDSSHLTGLGVRCIKD